MQYTACMLHRQMHYNYYDSIRNLYMSENFILIHLRLREGRD